MNPLQRAAVRRKAYYFAAILALFTLSMFWRGTIPLPLSGSAQAATALNRYADRVAARTIMNQATRLELRELEQGDPEIAGEAIRLGLVGSRGFVITYLWHTAIDKQKRNDFHEFELLVRTVTTLQPHFITPWIFQSWNIAYNISVEMHSIGDMYFYISRGIELLSEGERRNKRSPDMRYQIGFYYQNKFGVSDQVHTLRCLYQLSCIPPVERDPDSLLTPDKSAVDLVAFGRFCERHPHLIRRLRGEERYRKEKNASSEPLRVRTPIEVVAFLRDNRKVPSRYKNATELASPDKQFPILPPRFNEGPEEAYPEWVPADDTFSGFLAARAWFTYANALVPPNPRDEQGNPIPSGTPRPGTGPNEYDPAKYRVPRLPMLIIFRQGPPRAQTYQAELMEKEGWFDGSGWEVDAGVDEANAWFKTPVVVGKGTEWGRLAWEKAAEMWRKHGEEYALILRQNVRQQLREDAGLDPRSENDQTRLPPDPTPEQLADQKYARQYRATSALFFYHQNRSVTNFPFYLASAETEQKRETVQARKTLWQADQARRLGNKLEAIRLYEKGLEEWKQVLLKNPDFHRPERFDRVEEDTYEFELDYLRLIAQDDPRVRKMAAEDYAKAVLPVGALLPFVAAAPVIPEPARMDWNMQTAEKHFATFGGLVPVNPPDNRAGTPWVRNEVKQTVLSRQGIVRKPGEQRAQQPQPGPETR